ncbi:MAG TPA: TIGR03435 family protein [Bryobacteraceae bacterium]|nr:TIGR03435 family protein [Bryobacteraceae bacterium]
MTSSRRNLIAVAAFLSAVPLAAQQPAAPVFEVVSIRPVPQNAPPIMRDRTFTPILPGGEFIDPRIGLSSMIAFAYNFRNIAMQLEGLPGWAKSQAFSVSAKPAPGFPSLPPAENLEQVRLMIRAMLADRFHLQIHSETRQQKSFNLEVAKGGIRITEVEPPVPPATSAPVSAAIGDDGGHMIGEKSTMGGLAQALTLFLKRPVIDMTELKGYYDFNIRWKAPEIPGDPASSGSFGSESEGLLISNLQSQFGLRLTNTTSPVQYWIVDHVEPPTGN